MVLQGGKPAPGAPVLPVVAWDAAWLEPWRDCGQTVAAAVAQGMPVWQALNQHLQAPVAFCPHDQLPAGVPYEDFIAQTPADFAQAQQPPDPLPKAAAADHLRAESWAWA